MPLTARVTRRLAAEFNSRARPIARETFALNGRDYRYVFHPSNATWRTERSVELAIASEFYDPAERTLEIGNVLGQYFDGDHTVVDRYELGEGVINEDAETFRAEPFDSIISISTIEHIGWDEVPRDPGKIPRVVENLSTLLKPGGTLLVTLPVGYNRDLDDLLREQALPFDTTAYLVRETGATNHWRQADASEIGRHQMYGFPWPAANALAVATLRG